MIEPESANSDGVERIPDELILAFLPIHKRAFGLAVGIALGGFVFLVTVFAVVRTGYPPQLELLAFYLPGYSVSWAGAVIGFGWTAFSTFVAGWFAAFVRNFVIATSIWLAHARAELQATHDFLDHI